MTGPVPLYGEPTPTLGERLKKRLGPLAAVLATLGKFGAVLLKLKYVTVIGSLLLSIGGYALLFPWQVSVGLVLLIAVHETGHVVVLRARGIKAGIPVFLPFLGAFVSMKSQPRTAYDESLSGIAGPVFGVAGAFVALGIGLAFDSDLFRVLAYLGFFLNLFNLFPVLPLDGGRTVASLSPKIWLLGLVGLLAYEVYRPSPVIPIVLVLGGIELHRRWKGRATEASRFYYDLTKQQRLLIGSSYLGLVAVILWAMHAYPVPPVPGTS